MQTFPDQLETCMDLDSKEHVPAPDVAAVTGDDAIDADGASPDHSLSPKVAQVEGVSSTETRCMAVKTFVDANPMAFFLSADWSKDAKKRSVHVADLHERRIRYAECGGWNLAKLLALARKYAHWGPVLIGIDLAIGLPNRYWQALLCSGRHGDPASFVEWLGQRDPDSDFFRRVRSPSEWRVDRPFFHVPKGKGGRKSFEEKLDGGFYRRIDAKAGAKPLFAVSGIPGVVGSATRAFWKELVPLLRAGDRDFAVWPFEGELNELLRDRRIVLAETYPALAYGTVLAGELPAHQVLVAKTKCEQRRAVCERIAVARWVESAHVDLGDLGPLQDDTESAEDAFDSHVTAAAVMRCILDNRPLVAPDWIDPVAEGSMLLAGPVDPAPPSRRFRMPPSAQTQGPRRDALRRASPPAANDTPLPKGTEYRCPIPQCDKVFRGSRGGWDAHVASTTKHPVWHPDVVDGKKRKDLFRREYPDWFDRSGGHSG